MARFKIISVLAFIIILSGVCSSEAFARGRMYHAGMGRFMQRDPLGTAIAPPMQVDAVPSRNYSSPQFTQRDVPGVQYRGPASLHTSPPSDFREVPDKQYPDGMNLYAAYHVIHGTLDPSGMTKFSGRNEISKQLKELCDCCIDPPNHQDSKKCKAEADRIALAFEVSVNFFSDHPNSWSKRNKGRQNWGDSRRGWMCYHWRHLSYMAIGYDRNWKYFAVKPVGQPDNSKPPNNLHNWVAATVGGQQFQQNGKCTVHFDPWTGKGTATAFNGLDTSTLVYTPTWHDQNVGYTVKQWKLTAKGGYVDAEGKWQTGLHGVMSTTDGNWYNDEDWRNAIWATRTKKYKP